MTQKTPTRPARPERLSFRFAREGDRLALEHRTGSRGGGCFLLLWLIGWTVGCVFLAGHVLEEPTIFNLLFALPFWASWVFVFFMLFYLFFGREYLLLDRRGAAFQRKALIRFGRRRTPLDEIKRFHSHWTRLDDESGSSCLSVEMETLGLPLRFAQGVSGAEQTWLVAELNDHLASLKAEMSSLSEPHPSDDAAEPDADETPDEGKDAQVPSIRALGDSRRRRRESRGRVLELAHDSIRSPSDSRWLRDESFAEIVFVSKGRISWAAVSGALFINLFWNGIVSVFVIQMLGFGPAPPPGAMRWGMAVFLIPFEVIGLLMFTALLASAFQPFHYRKWTVGRSEIRASETWFGFGPVRTWLVSRLDRLEVGRGEGSGLTRLLRGRLHGLGKIGDPPDDAPTSYKAFKLSLIDRDNNELCSLGRVTEGEARWIGDVILRERPEWFGRT